MKRKIGAFITSLLMCVALTAVTIGATEIPQTVPTEDAQTEISEAELTESDIAEPELTEAEAEAADEYSDEAFHQKYVSLFSEDAYEKEMSAVSTAGSDLQSELTAQRFLILGDSTAINFNDIVGWPTRLTALRPSTIDCRAVGGASYTSYRQSNVISQMNEVDLTDYDAVFMLFGANDFVICAEPGTVTSTKLTTVCGALNVAINRCQNANLKCYVVLPFPCENQFTGKTNEIGDTYLLYINTIKRLCNYRNVDMIDFNAGLGVNADNFRTYYMDFIHPNNALHAIAADYVNNFLGQDNESEYAVQLFVERLYNFCLSRESEAEGLNYWTSMLTSKQATGVDAAKFFFFSDEFQSHKYSDKQYVRILYHTMLDREPDEEGLQYWLSFLENGLSRTYILKELSESKEFRKICATYGIEKGTCELTEGRDLNPGLTAFVARLYTQAMGRSYDIDGLNYWCGEIQAKHMSIMEVSTVGFFHAPEFYDKKLNDEQYITVLYRTFLGREPEAGGMSYWTSQLKSGVTRDEVLAGFAYSPEFGEIQKFFGL